MAPWNGSGGFTRDNGAFTGAETWKRTANAGHNVRSDQQDAHDQDLAQGLENCLARDGQNSPTADLPMNAKKHTSVAGGTARDHYATLGQVQDGTAGWIPRASVSGSRDAITLTPVPPITAYAEGQRFTFGVKHDNTGAVAIDVSGRGAKNLRMRTRDCIGGDLFSGDRVTVLYDGAQFRLMDFTPGSAAFHHVGTGSRDVPVLGDGGVPAGQVIPDLPASKITSGGVHDHPHPGPERRQDHVGRVRGSPHPEPRCREDHGRDIQRRPHPEPSRFQNRQRHGLDGPHPGSAGLQDHQRPLRSGADGAAGPHPPGLVPYGQAGRRR